MLKLLPFKIQMKIITIILFVMSATASVTFGESKQQPNCQSNNLKINGIYLPVETEIQNFKLTDNNGKNFTKKNLAGQWTLVFFGFTNCPMVCPATLAALDEMYRSLKNKLSADQLPNIVFISVDPKRDTTARLNEYVNAFNPHFIGARADINETQALMKQLHIIALKIEASKEGKDRYVINHTSEILVFNPNAKLQAYLSYPHYAKQMTKDYQLILQAFKACSKS